MEEQKLPRDVFIKMRDKILKSFNKNNVKYKLFGGAVVAIFDEQRETSDMDLTIKAEEESLHAFLAALEDAEFGTAADLLKQITDAFEAEKNSPYSDINICNEDEITLYSGGYGLYSDNSNYEGFHIDLCFNIGEHNYDTMQSE